MTATLKQAVVTLAAVVIGCVLLIIILAGCRKASAISWTPSFQAHGLEAHGTSN